MFPIHAYEVNRAGFAVPLKMTKTIGQEARKLLFAHLSRGHGKLSMFNGAIPGGVTVDSHVIRRIGKYDVCLLAIHEPFITCGIERRVAENSVLFQDPQITPLCDGPPDFDWEFIVNIARLRL